MALTQREHSFLGILSIFGATLAWGASFIFQKTSIEHMSPLVFNGVRYLIGAVALLPVVAVYDWSLARSSGMSGSLLWGSGANTSSRRRFLMAGGVINGLLMGAATMLQHYGMIYTTAGKAGFITALYILFVPIIGLFLGRRAGWQLWLCVLLGLSGAFMLCNGGDIGGGINLGDGLILMCAIGFAMQILATDHYAPHTDCLRLSLIEFAVAGVFSLAVSVITRQPFSWHGVRMALGALLYCGIMSSGVGYTLQNVGQKYVRPVTASLLMSLESVFSAFFSWWLLGERMNGRELLGCATIFVAIILAQLASAGNSDASEKQVANT